MLLAQPAVPRSVFIVDRDPAYLEAVAQGFRNAGLQAYPLAGCVQAIATARIRPPDVLIIDQRLTHDGGVSLLSRLRTANPRLRAVVMTRVPSISAAVRAIREGFDDYVAAPIAPAKLLELVNGPAAGPVTSSWDDGAANASHRLPSLFEVEWEHIHAVLYDCRGNITRAARALGLDRRSLQRKLRRQAPSPGAAAGPR
jgi:two-component system response regulator RegA